MLFHKKKKEVKSYDKENYEPVLHSSICTGEKTAGFRHRQSGKFVEERLIMSDKDIKEFKELYGITEELKTIY